MTTPAVLALEDGTVFRGVSIGAAGTSTGEVVFNTAMTGYQEILTDPSYARQIVTLTYPHIGNTGTNPDDHESNLVHAAGLVIRDLPLLHSSWRATESLPEFLRRREHRRDRRDRHPQAHPHPARERRPGRLHRQRRRRTAPGSRDRGRTPLPGPQGHGPRQGRLHRARLPVERRHQLVAGAGAASPRRASACTSSPTTSASSATSCGCWPTTAAA